MSRRSRLEMYFDILRVMDKGVEEPTRIMFKTNLSWVVLQDMFDTLISGQFVTEEIKGGSGKRVYRVTEKGRNALSYYQKSLDGLLMAKPLLISR